ncbi:MAG: hypothetical protein ACREXR_08340, partial [Gammaproteobacteria bacterium]
PVANVQLATTPSATQKSGQKAVTGAHRHDRFILTKIAMVALHDLLVSFVLGPANIARVMVLNKDLGGFRWPGAPWRFTARPSLTTTSLARRPYT